ncbi:hypothetical protein B296_00010368 [Ensete ventricosum]|uniref:Uncharacterized protein n=1 Tax=Ensete ventricosum TaxID=4639 RepID=A0A426ZWU9_ENSVE|nr:hypothetical protein B296_00010368 [Ensete ventricosum]
MLSSVDLPREDTVLQHAKHTLRPWWRKGLGTSVTTRSPSGRGKKSIRITTTPWQSRRGLQTLESRELWSIQGVRVIYYILMLSRIMLVPMASTLIGFTGDSISPLGITTLPVIVEEEPRSKMLMISFMVVGLSSAYNAILGCPTLNKLRAVVSTYHRTMKFPTNIGVGEARSDPRESRQCYLIATTLPKKIKPQAPITDPREPNKTTP